MRSPGLFGHGRHDGRTLGLQPLLEENIRLRLSSEQIIQPPTQVRITLAGCFQERSPLLGVGQLECRLE